MKKRSINNVKVILQKLPMSALELVEEDS